MTRMVYCVKLKKEAPGLAAPPYPGELGVKIYKNISMEAWQGWMDVQTRLVNENRLNLADARARKYVKQQMENYLFEGHDIEAQGYVPPSA
ncbi:oxidative damage protection protein [Pelistega europaea]|uniref:Probable Fe(2+)-trafficking protein n=1 Tax=Pelistega europaea TaxID=106147 RepID=A0A7Y4LC06_9BURK|nr:oxidative damage protection protein [Pelistega europaea]NOL49657.1 oxidative damage protection protein [Pelistega europaea]